MHCYPMKLARATPPVLEPKLPLSPIASWSEVLLQLLLKGCIVITIYQIHLANHIKWDVVMQY